MNCKHPSGIYQSRPVRPFGMARPSNKRLVLGVVIVLGVFSLWLQMPAHSLSLRIFPITTQTTRSIANYTVLDTSTNDSMKYDSNATSLLNPVTIERFPMDSQDNKKKLTNVSLGTDAFSKTIPPTVKREHLQSQEEGPLKATNIHAKYEVPEQLPSGYRQIWCDNCFRHDYGYLNKPIDACSLSGNPVPQLDMVMAIPSGATERLQRDVVRGTWASVTRKNTHPKVRHVFLLGAIHDEHEQTLINNENEKHNDIVQQSFVDTYNNLTLKSMMMMEWTITYCNNARYIFKADSDLFVNPSKIQDIIQGHKEANTLIGRCSSGANPIRNPKSKWVLTKDMYPQQKFPPICLGPRYLLPVKIAPAILEAAANTPMLRLEDVYIGMCLAKTPYHVENVNAINPFGEYLMSRDCERVRKVVTKHSVRGASLVSIWMRCFSK